MKIWNYNSSAFCRGWVATTVLVAVLAVQAEQNDTKTTDYKKQEKGAHVKSGATDTASLIQEASKMNVATLRFSELAAQKAQSPEVKRFAQTLRQDHQRAQTDLESIAKKHSVTLATTLDQKCQEEISKLEAKSGQEFDREFAKGAVEGHAMAVACLQQSTSNTKEADLRQYNQKMLAKVREHQQLAREIAKTVGVDEATIASLETKAQEEASGGPASTSQSSSSSSNPGNYPNNKSSTDNSSDKK